MSEGDQAQTAPQDAEATALRGSGLVRHLMSRWEAANAGDGSALLASGEELPPISQLPPAPRAFAGPAGAAPAARGAPRQLGASPQLLQSVLQEEDPEERVESFEVEERRPGGRPAPEGEDDGVEDPRRTSLVQFVRAQCQNRGELRVVFKSPKPSPEVAKVMDVAAMSAKEAGLYQHVLPNMEALWPEQPFNVFPRCLHASADVIILEDLREAGFEEVSAEGGLSEDQCAAILAALARFHAASLAYKSAGLAEAGAALAEAGLETVYAESRRAQLEPLLAAAARNTLELLKRHPQASKHAAAVKRLLDERFSRLGELHRAREPGAVLTHGDPRARNALFRARSEEERDAEGADAPRLEARLLDLRACRYGSPALDLARLLYGGGASPEARGAMDALLRGYYRALTRALKTAPGAPAPPFTIFELRKEVEQYAVYGLLTADLSLRLQLNAAAARANASEGSENGEGGEEGEEGEEGEKGSEKGQDAEAAVEDFITSNAPGDAFARAFGNLVLELADKGLLK